jgi:hypothetical protein
MYIISGGIAAEWKQDQGKQEEKENKRKLYVRQMVKQRFMDRLFGRVRRDVTRWMVGSGAGRGV